MENPTAFTLAFAAATAAYFLDPKSAMPKIEKNIVDRFVASEQKSLAADVLLRTECPAKAREEFRRFGWNSQSPALLRYHYNNRLKKCFVDVLVIVTDSRGGRDVARSLSDTQGREYASFMTGEESATSSLNPGPAICETVLASGEEMECHSASEFEKIVRDYMQ